jgi:hypothetical protein
MYDLPQPHGRPASARLVSITYPSPRFADQQLCPSVLSSRSDDPHRYRGKGTSKAFNGGIPGLSDNRLLQSCTSRQQIGCSIARASPMRPTEGSRKGVSASTVAGLMINTTRRMHSQRTRRTQTTSRDRTRSQQSTATSPPGSMQPSTSSRLSLREVPLLDINVKPGWGLFSKYSVRCVRAAPHEGHWSPAPI